MLCMPHDRYSSLKQQIQNGLQIFRNPLNVTVLPNQRLLPQPNQRLRAVSRARSSQDPREAVSIDQWTRRCVLSFGGILLSLGVASEGGAYLVDEDLTEKIYRKAEASVVSIANMRRKGGEATEESVATGIVWDARGYVVTNYHCIQPTFQDQTGAMYAVVRVGPPGAQQKEFKANIFRTDADHDLAVLTFDAPDGLLEPAKLGSSAELRVGQSVFAMGSSYGLSKTFTAGVVSGLGRGIPTPSGAIATGAIQTDASINQGNSGGPLLDSSGRLMGLNTATFSNNKSMGRGSGVNFAISVDTMRDIVPKLIVYGNSSGRS